MSRGVRDLRELICVSRLTFCHSDEELVLSDEEEGRLSRGLDSLSLSSSGCDSRQDLANSVRGLPSHCSPDSGFHTNGCSPETASFHDVASQKQGPVRSLPQPPGVEKPAAARKKKRRKKKVVTSLLDMQQLSQGFSQPDLVSDSRVTHSSSASSSDGLQSSLVSPTDINSPTHNKKTPLGPIQPGRRRRQWARPDGNFDNLLTYIDATLVSEWLSQANEAVANMTQWIHTGENYVHFAHFWISDFPALQRQDIFKLEISIILDHLGVAFAAGKESRHVKHKDLNDFLEAVFHEYPAKLLSSKGSHMFLDYLDVLTSERKDEYKKLLADVRCSTKVKQYAQWTLAVRAFALVSVWSAVLNFYRRLAVNSSRQGLPIPPGLIAKSNPNHQRAYLAIRNSYVDVLNYLIHSGKVDPRVKDSHNKTLVLFAVVQNQAKVLQYLLNQVKPSPDVSEAADTGNTPLHAAANTGNIELMRILLKARDIQVDKPNPQCDRATPLHLAVMHGHAELVELLLENKANGKRKMGDLTVVDIARDFGHDEVLLLLRRKGLT